jgi:HEAT repeat protein
VKATAAQAAGQLSLFDAAPMLAELLGDEDWWVRFRAGEALLKLGNTGLTILQDTARNAPETARDAATSILAEKGLAA